MSPASREDVARLAQEISVRSTKIDAILKDVLEPDVALQLGDLIAENITAARNLAQWFLKQPAPLVRPRICLVVDRLDGHLSEHQIGGSQVTSAMLEAAENLLLALTTGERQLPRDLYDLIAKAFATTHDDAKARIWTALYGVRTAP